MPINTEPINTMPDPDALVATRTALHRLASTVIAPVRYAAIERFGLIATPGGFGTPRFPDSKSGTDRQIRVDGLTLIDGRRGPEGKSHERTTSITTLREAAAFLEADIDPDTAREHDSPELGDVDEMLAIDPLASAFLGTWFNAAFDALTMVRATSTAVDPSLPQLWPGHFDPAIESGTEATRASYGASPGDPGSPEPYLYVSVWYPDAAAIDAGDPFWNGTTFTGRVLRLSEFPAAVPLVDAATDFWVDVTQRLSQ